MTGLLPHPGEGGASTVRSINPKTEAMIDNFDASARLSRISRKLGARALGENALNS